MLTFSNTVRFVKGESAPVLLRNFYEPENGFVWSTSTWAEIIFAFADARPNQLAAVDLILDLDVFKAPPALPWQTVKVYLNGLRVGSRDVSERSLVLIPFEAKLLKPYENVLTFDTPDACLPADFGIPDGRRLGLQLFSLQCRPGG